MPSIRRSNVAAGTANDVDGLQFQDIPEPGALVTIYSSTAVAGGEHRLQRWDGTLPRRGLRQRRDRGRRCGHPA